MIQCYQSTVYIKSNLKYIIQLYSAPIKGGSLIREAA